MYLKAKKIIEELTGFTIYRKQTPWGLNLHKDIRHLTPGWLPEVIFDVGANVGQTAIAFHKEWSNASIFSFEPVKNTFAILKTATQGLPNVEVIPLALGSTPGESSIKLFSDSRLASLDHQVSLRAGIDYETIKISTVDEFCSSHSIEKISLLKIDTEGHDLEVLKGSTGLLEAGKINYILAEISAGTFPGKISVSDMNQFLRSYRMVCVGIYNQGFWQQPRLYYGNALFVSETILI